MTGVSASGAELALTRRTFVSTALGAAVLLGVSPEPARAQRPSGPYRVGVLNDARAANHPATDGLRAGLRALGFEEGRDMVFEVPLTDGNRDRLPVTATALVKAGVDVIFTSTEAATLAARAATGTIPIVFTLVGDPVASGIVASLAHPGGHLTGVSSLTTELVPKRLEALKALAPGLRRVWAIDDASDAASRAISAKAIESASRFGLEILARTVRAPAELQHVLEELRPEDGMLVPDLATMDISAM